MAWSEIETKIANPARKGTMAKKLSAKQIKYFGTLRQKAALKAKRKASASSHRPRTKPKKSNPASYHKKKKRAASNASKPRKKQKLTASNPKRKNPGELIAFLTGNPARKKGKAMAKTDKKKKKSAASSSAGRPHKKKMVKNRAKRKNPSIGRPMDWVKGGVGVIAGGVGTRVIPQFLGATNAGAMGYGLNAVTAIGLSFLAHMFTKDNVITAAVAAGGFAALILRVIGDNTPYGSQLALSGFGDYMVSNFVTPQRIVNPGAAIFEVPNGWGSTPAIMSPMGAGSGADAGTDGNSY